jgi:hypothetical protein
MAAMTGQRVARIQRCPYTSLPENVLHIEREKERERVSE